MTLKEGSGGALTIHGESNGLMRAFGYTIETTHTAGIIHQAGGNLYARALAIILAYKATITFIRIYGNGKG